MLSKHALVLVATVLMDTTIAATAVSNEQMVRWLNAGGVDLAVAYAPIWFFGQSQDRPPCIPTWAYGGNPDTQDIYDSNHKTSAGDLCNFANVGCNCRNPGVDIGNPAPPFPIYYTYNQCNDNEIRVAYNLFYEKDGVNAAGHGYDWERVIVVHQRSGDGQWSPAQALLSQHSGYDRKGWGDIQNSLTTDEVNQGLAKDPNGVQNNDHPKVYVSWSKHADFDTRNTGWNDVLSQSLSNAFRSQDWWYFVDPKYYIRADGSTTAGQVIGGADWGEADSNPLRVHEGLCSA